MDFDADSNGTLTNTADLQDCRTHTQSNEIKERDFGCDSPSVPNRKPKYNAVGQWVDDDQTVSSTVGNAYTWDVFGRLIKVTSKSSGTPVIADFTYDARNQRTI